MATIVKKSEAWGKGFRKLERIIANIAIGLLMILMLLGAADVIGRYVFDRPIFGALEVEKLLMATVVFLGWAYVLSEHGHVMVDIIFTHYPRRLQAIIRFITLLLSLVPFVLITWSSASTGITDLQAGLLIATIRIPEGPFLFTLTLGAFFLCIEVIIQIIEVFPRMFPKKES